MRTHDTAETTGRSGTALVLKLFYLVTIPVFFYILVLSMAAPTNSYELLPTLTVGATLLTWMAVYRYRTGVAALLARWCDSRKAVGIAVTLWAVLLLYFSIALQVDFQWDYGGAMRAAFLWATQGSVGDMYLQAYARYPNNQLLVVFLYGICKAFLVVVPGATLEAFRVVGCVLSAASVFSAGLLTAKAASLFERRMGRIFLLLYMTCIPLWLYTPICYTDTLGLPLLAGAFWCVAASAKAGQGKGGVKWLILLGVLMGVAFAMKVTLVIALIATLICGALYYLQRRQIKDLCRFVAAVLLPTLLTALLLQTGTARLIGITDQLREEYAFPTTHWIMMSMYAGEDSYGAGGYRQADVDYTRSFPTLAERETAVKARLLERLQTSPRTLGKHVLYQKVRRTWTSGSLAADDYAGREPVKRGALHDIFLYGGTHWKTTRGIMQLWWTSLLTLTLLGMLAQYRQRRVSLAFLCHLTLFGFFLFYLIWETNPRYLVVLVPVLALSAADGLSRFTQTDRPGKQMKQEGST